MTRTNQTVLHACRRRISSSSSWPLIPSLDPRPSTLASRPRPSSLGPLPSPFSLPCVTISSVLRSIKRLPGTRQPCNARRAVPRSWRKRFSATSAGSGWTPRPSSSAPEPGRGTPDLAVSEDRQRGPRGRAGPRRRGPARKAAPRGPKSRKRRRSSSGRAATARRRWPAPGPCVC